MATLSTYSYFTAYDLIQRYGLGGSVVMVVEVLNNVNPFFADASWAEANEVLSNRGLRRLNLPTGSWRRLNNGVAAEMAKETPYTDTIGMLATRSKCDGVLANAHPGGVEAYRTERARAFVEGMSQTMSTAIVYANAGTDPEKFTGLAPRMDALTTNHVLSCGGTGSDLTSIYCVQWGPERCQMMYPKGSPTIGIKHVPIGSDGNDGMIWLEDTSGYKYRGYEDYFEINCGMVVHDDRCIKRVCNIETSGTSNIFDEDKLIEALEEMPYEGQGAVIYCNKTVRRQMRIAAKDKGNIWYAEDSTRGLSGKKVMMFDEWPVRRSDAIVNTEDAVS